MGIDCHIGDEIAVREEFIIPVHTHASSGEGSTKSHRVLALPGISSSADSKRPGIHISGLLLIGGEKDLDKIGFRIKDKAVASAKGNDIRLRILLNGRKDLALLDGDREPVVD